MAKFIIQPHGRLQEWIAHEKGYFRDEGLDYEFATAASADARSSSMRTGKVADMHVRRLRVLQGRAAATRA